MRVKNENELLKVEVRKQIIEEIKASENQERKREAYKRYLCFKDKTKEFVLEQLIKQFDYSTVEEMAYAVSNISLVRKIIEKLARVYNNGVKREISKDETSSENLHKLEKELDINTALRNANKFLKLQKNLTFYIKPCPVIDKNGVSKYTLKLEPMNPYLYDVVENYHDRTKPMAYVLSDFDYSPMSYVVNGDVAQAGRVGPVVKTINPYANSKDEAIADSPSDAKTCEYVWWSDSYHFTTNEKGEITSGADTINPIGEMPFENFALEQDGQFWAQGGDDLIDGGILINSVLTHNQHVAISQGYGQFWMSGKNLPTNIKVGPSKAILMQYQEGEPVPALGFANASPALDSMGKMVDTYVALLLTTNNLSTSAVSSSLNGQQLTASGIAMVIDKAESMEDVNDQRQVFIDKEPSIWRKVNKWLKAYGDNLVDSLKGLELPETFEKEFAMTFLDAPVIMSEKEKLENLRLRKDLGIDTMVDLIMKDNPQITKEQAEEKLKELLEEKIKTQMQMREQGLNPDGTTALDQQSNDPNADPAQNGGGQDQKSKLITSQTSTGD